jgi:hypothetical protein
VVYWLFSSAIFHKKAPFLTGLFIKVVFIYLKTKQQASTNVIHIDATYIHTLRLNTIFDCLVNCLNSNWSIEGQYTNFAKDSFMNTSIAANGTKTTKEDTLSGKSFGVTGLYHFNPM